jgi:hypothetical protein
MRRILSVCGLLTIFCSLMSPAYATSVQYNLVDLGGGDYRYVYSITNDGSLGSGVPIQLFDIFFDPAQYLESSLSVTTPPPLNGDWDQIFLASSPGVPAAYDALASAGGIADGATVTGFSVDFQWIGTGTPGVQPYEIYDPNTFALLEQGVSASPVPVPAALWLFSSGLVTLLGARSTRKGTRHFTD